MAFNNNVPVPAASWTRLNNATISALRAQNLSGYTVTLMATAGAVAPSVGAGGGIVLYPGSILSADLTLAQLWPGVTGTDVYAWCDQAATVSVSHA